MGNIVEFCFPRAVEHANPFLLHQYLQGAIARVFEPGDAADITEESLRNDYLWHLQVNRRGVGMLTIRGVAPQYVCAGSGCAKEYPRHME